MRFLVNSLILACLAITPAVAGEGMISVQSTHSVPDTANRFAAILEASGMTLFARIDHAAGARQAGMSMPPAELLIFGNAKVGTPLMLCSPSIAIDLPQKALIWEGADGKTWISYNDPMFLQRRHNTQGCDEVLQKVAAALGKFSSKAGAAE